MNLLVGRYQYLWKFLCSIHFEFFIFFLDSLVWWTKVQPLHERKGSSQNSLVYLKKIDPSSLSPSCKMISLPLIVV